MQLPDGSEILEWIIKWSHIIEPHVFTFAQPDIQSQLYRTCSAEWIRFIDHQSVIDHELLQDKLLTLIKFSDPSIDSGHVPDEDYWPKSMICYLRGKKQVFND
jgi:hypothetical protein